MQNEMSSNTSNKKQHNAQNDKTLEINSYFWKGCCNTKKDNNTKIILENKFFYYNCFTTTS